jgi:hypothetical protein
MGFFSYYFESDMSAEEGLRGEVGCAYLAAESFGVGDREMYDGGY